MTSTASVSSVAQRVESRARASRTAAASASSTSAKNGVRATRRPVPSADGGLRHAGDPVAGRLQRGDGEVELDAAVGARVARAARRSACGRPPARRGGEPAGPEQRVRARQRRVPAQRDFGLGREPAQPVRPVGARRGGTRSRRASSRPRPLASTSSGDAPSSRKHTPAGLPRNGSDANASTTRQSIGMLPGMRTSTSSRLSRYSMTARTSPVPTPSPGLHADLGDRAGLLGVDVVLHLHRLEHEHGLAGLDRVADADEHLHDRALHRRADRAVARRRRRRATPRSASGAAPPPARVRRRRVGQPHLHRVAAAVDLDRHRPLDERARRRPRAAGSSRPRRGRPQRREPSSGRLRPRPTSSSARPRGTRRCRAARGARGSSCGCPRSRTRRAHGACGRSRGRGRAPTRRACR